MTSESKVLGACPLDCPDGCSWVVTVRDGAAVGLRGNPEHPYTRGALCVKVNRYLEQTGAADRVLYPMRRTGPKGSGRFERVSWGEALDEIAARLRAIIGAYGGEAIWPYQGTGSLGFIQGEGAGAGRRLWNALGASRHSLNICAKAGGAGLSLVNGTSAGMDAEAFGWSKLILLWGTNPLTSGHHAWRFIQRARARGAHLVAIDPVRTRTADQADEYLPIRPGTDAALAFGLVHVVLQEGAEDRDFLERHTLGWDEFRAEILKYPPSVVAEITGLPAESIRSLGVRLAHTRPTGIRATMGVQRHAGGGAALRAIACVPGVTGDWRHPGGGVSYATGAHAPLRLDSRDDLLPHPVRTLAMTRLAEGLEIPPDGSGDIPVKCLWVYGANPLGSSPDQGRIRRGLLREDLFTVVMEHFRTDTADYADLVLPATMQTEHIDVHNGYGHLYLAWNEPAVPPPGECLSTTETFRRVAKAMGLTDPSLYESDLELAEQLLSGGHPALAGITVDRLRKEGWVRLNLPDPFLPFADGFPTPSGRLEFASELAVRQGLSRVPGYVPPGSAAAGGPYPLTMVTPARHEFLNTVFGNNAELRRRAGGPRVLVNAADAAARGLSGGDRARVFNDTGEFLAEVEISDRVRPGVVATFKGHWPKHSPGGANVNALVEERDADLGRGPVFHDNRVELAAAR